MIRMVDVLSARARAKYLEAALARAAGELQLEKSLRAEALALEERVQRMQRRKAEIEERRTRDGVAAMLGRIDDLKAKGIIGDAG